MVRGEPALEAPNSANGSLRVSHELVWLPQVASQHGCSEIFDTQGKASACEILPLCRVHWPSLTQNSRPGAGPGGCVLCGLLRGLRVGDLQEFHHQLFLCSEVKQRPWLLSSQTLPLRPRTVPFSGRDTSFLLLLRLSREEAQTRCQRTVFGVPAPSTWAIEPASLVLCILASLWAVGVL